jgi:hypothetical protein
MKLPFLFPRNDAAISANLLMCMTFNAMKLLMKPHLDRPYARSNPRILGNAKPHYAQMHGLSKPSSIILSTDSLA